MYTDYCTGCLINLSSDQTWDLHYFTGVWNSQKDLYNQVGLAADIPAILVAAIHMREASCDFTTYLHNGDPLGKPTTDEPKGIFFTDWKSAAIDAITRETRAKRASGCVYTSTDFEGMCIFATYYNGLGYQNLGVVDPYILAGTTCYSQGKFSNDGHYDSNEVDQELGILPMLRTIGLESV